MELKCENLIFTEYWKIGIFSSANSSTGYLPKLIFVEHLLCAMHHAGIWRHTAELDLVLAQDPRPDGRYGLAAVGSEVVVCLHELPQGFWSSFIIHCCFPRISTRRSLCWSCGCVSLLKYYATVKMIVEWFRKDAKHEKLKAKYEK